MSECMTCRKCGKILEPRKVIFQYLGNHISYELPTCPDCGTSFVSKELAEGKISEVELLLEDK